MSKHELEAIVADMTREIGNYDDYIPIHKVEGWRDAISTITLPFIDLLAETPGAPRGEDSLKALVVEWTDPRKLGSDVRFDKTGNAVVAARQHCADQLERRLSALTAPSAETPLDDSSDAFKALLKLSSALGNPCLETGDGQTLEDALVEFAIAKMQTSAETPRGEVTEEMIDAAFEGANWDVIDDTDRDDMRAALEAALSLPKPTDVGKAGASGPTETPAVEEAEPTEEQSRALRRTFDALDALADMWAEKVDLQRMAVGITQQGVDAVANFAKLAWTEGAYEGRTSLKTYPVASASTAGKESESIPLHPKAIDEVNIERGGIWPTNPINGSQLLHLASIANEMQRQHDDGRAPWLNQYDIEAVRAALAELRRLREHSTPPIAPQDKAAPSTLDAGTDSQPMPREWWVRLLKGCDDGFAHLTFTEAWTQSKGGTEIIHVREVSTQNAERTTNQSRCTQAGNQTDGGECEHKNQAWNLRFTKGVCKDCHADLPADAYVGEARTADHSEKPR